MASGQIFRYQDEQGVWHFTDVPPKGYAATIVPDISLSVASAPTPTARIADLAARLEDAYAPVTPLAYATLSVVSIKSDVAEGSGFFCTEEGHILTTRHVVQPEADEVLDGPSLDERERELASIHDGLKETQRQLEFMKADLEQYERLIAEARDEETRAWAQDAKDRLLDRYRTERTKVANLERSADAVRAGVLHSRQERGFQRGLASASRRFEILLKDGTELVANLVEVSADRDLALLKLDGYRTPALPVDLSRSLSQGMRVFAIGNPLGMHDAVTSGVVTRITPDHLLTDAQILPGSSGGPLIRESGEVVGITVSRTVAAGDPIYAAGLGKAIPILVAMQAFPALLTATTSESFEAPEHPHPEPTWSYGGGRGEDPRGAAPAEQPGSELAPAGGAPVVRREGGEGRPAVVGAGGDPPVRLILGQEGPPAAQGGADAGSHSLDFPPEGTSVLPPGLSSPRE